MSPATVKVLIYFYIFPYEYSYQIQCSGNDNPFILTFFRLPPESATIVNLSTFPDYVALPTNLKDPAKYFMPRGNNIKLSSDQLGEAAFKIEKLL